MIHKHEYEAMCVYAPDVQDDQLKKIEEKIQKIFATHNVEDLKRKDWGNRLLAYPISRYKTGHFVQYEFKADTTLIKEMEKNLGYEESVLRYLTLRHTKHSRKGVEMEPAGYDVME